jgi:hypothetical protein
MYVLRLPVYVQVGKVAPARKIALWSKLGQQQGEF